MAEPSFLPTDEQQLLSSTLRELLAGTGDLDRTREMSLSVEAFDKVAWGALMDMGIIAMVSEWRPGGSEPSFRDVAAVFEELGRAMVPVPVLSVLMAATLLGELGGEKAAAVRNAISEGAVVPALALFEDERSEEVAAGAVTAEQVDGGWRIAGTKRYVIDAPIADRILVTARAVDDTIVALVDTDAVELEAVHGLDATRPLGHLHLDVTVGNDEVLAVGGPEVQRAVRVALDAGVVAVAQEQVGGAQRCLESSVEYAATRYQFGRAIGSFQAVKHACADMLVAVEHARSAALHAAATIDDPVESAISIPLAHGVCSEAYEFVAGQTIQVHGGIGFTWEHDAHLYFKRAKASSLLLRSVSSSLDRLGDAIGV